MNEEHLGYDNPECFVTHDNHYTDLIYWIESRIFPARKVWHETSYGLKHRFTSPSNRNGYYISNGVFKGAMVFCGFQPIDRREQNWRFKIHIPETVMRFDEGRVKASVRSISPGLRFQVFKRDNYSCQICGYTVQDGVKLEVDHKVAWALGGDSDIENLWTLCQECNRGKSDRSL